MVARSRLRFADPESHVSVPLPKTIGRYEIREELGRGMMGVVYRAEDPLLGRDVAVKTIRLAPDVPEAERHEFEQRFFAEARAAARLSHPGIVVVYDVGRDTESGQLFMALEYLKGSTLETLLRESGAFDWRIALRLGISLAQALHHAHSAGIVHRDVKPANIMVLESGPKIMDFGIAKLPAAPGQTAGQIAGSPSYMCPERAMGGATDLRGDLFGLGAVLYEVLTGARAFSGDSVGDILTKVAYENPIPPSRIVSRIPADMDRVVRRALAKNRADRYPSGHALADDLRDVLDGEKPRHLQGWVDSSNAPVTLPDPVAPPPPPKPRPPDEDTDKKRISAHLAFPPHKRVALAVLTGPRQGEVVVLVRPRLTIGRTAAGWGADLEIPDPEASRGHAAVECHGSRILLRDLDSTNGTYVGDNRIREAELDDRSEFRVGRTRFMLILTDQE
jgi:serine/threonine protein kinase